MIHDVVPWFTRRFPRARGHLDRSWYEWLSKQGDRPDLVFLDYGFAPEHGEPPLALDPLDEGDRHSIQLYARVVDSLAMEGRDALEVGCGRGGGGAWLARAYRPRSYVGLDRSHNAIEFCERRHHVPGLRFVQGEAESLPFPDASFDLVVNVESLHYYLDPRRFLAEVRRTLRPGGRFACADLFHHRDLDAWHEMLRDSQMHLDLEEDLTAGVLRSLDLDDGRRQAMVQARTPWIARPLVAQFAGIPGTGLVYARLADSTRPYRRYVLSRRS